MFVLCTIWGAQQVVVKLAAPDIAPAMLMALRSGLSALCAGAFMWRHGLGLQPRAGLLLPGLGAGALFALEFLLVAEGLRFTSASHMVVFLYTAPVFTALGLHWTLPAERLAAVQWLGVLVAFAGITVAFMGAAAQGAPDARTLFGDALGVAAGVAWAATTVLVRASPLAEAPAVTTLQYQLLVSFVLMLAYALATGQGRALNWSGVAIAALAFQGVVVSFASYLAWFWLLRRYRAAQLAVFSFITPLAGVAFGVLVLDEAMEAHFVAGAALVLAGIALVSGARLRAPGAGST